MKLFTDKFLEEASEQWDCEVTDVFDALQKVLAWLHDRRRWRERGKVMCNYASAFDRAEEKTTFQMWVEFSECRARRYNIRIANERPKRPDSDVDTDALVDRFFDAIDRYEAAQIKRGKVIRNYPSAFDRYGGLDLGFYGEHIPPDRMKVLTSMVGVKVASPDFDPNIE